MKIGKVCMKIPSVQDVSASSEPEGIFLKNYSASSNEVSAKKVLALYRYSTS